MCVGYTRISNTINTTIINNKQFIVKDYKPAYLPRITPEERLAFMPPIVRLFKLGRMSYVRALNVQQILFEDLKSQSSLSRNSLILVEHEPVYTIGIRSKQYNDIYVSELERQLADHKLKADFVKTNRGGLITFHGPGQLVAYPIIYLGDFKETIKNRSVKTYVNLLEATIIDTLARVGLNGAHTIEGQPGVWLDEGRRKIAFIGISCKRFVTMHGISINCNCDLSWFDHIVSCGIEDKIITSVRQELLLSGRVGSNNHDNENARGCLELIYGKNRQEPKSSSINYFKMAKLGSMVEDHLIESTSNIEHISQAFCQSFSLHFDCKLEHHKD